ncbi:MAG: redoxin family protein, partial [Candidatus Nanopelagicaceae bacterium]
MRKEDYQVPQVEFVFRVGGEFVTKTTAELFNNKRVVIFSLPGAYTPTCSAYQLPGFEEKYDEFAALGIDAIY